MKGISFTTPMVLALLNTRPGVWPAEPIDPSKPFKWQTRRIVKPQPFDGAYCTKCLKDTYACACEFKTDAAADRCTKSARLKDQIPRFKTGEIAYVKEGIYKGEYWDGSGNYVIRYSADNQASLDPHGWRWQRSSLAPRFMPADFARMEVEIKAVRAELLQDISEADAIAEGIDLPEDGVWTDYSIRPEDNEGYNHCPSAVKSYSTLINSINPGSWEANPWMLAYTIARLK